MGLNFTKYSFEANIGMEFLKLENPTFYRYSGKFFIQNHFWYHGNKIYLGFQPKNNFTITNYWNPLSMTLNAKKQPFHIKVVLKNTKYSFPAHIGLKIFKLEITPSQIWWKLFSVKIILGIMEIEYTQGFFQKKSFIWHQKVLQSHFPKRRLRVSSYAKPFSYELNIRKITILVIKDHVVDRGSHEKLLKSCHND